MRAMIITSKQYYPIVTSHHAEAWSKIFKKGDDEDLLIVVFRGYHGWAMKCKPLHRMVNEHNGQMILLGKE